MEKNKKYINMKILEWVYLNLYDYKRIFELQERKKVTFSELIQSLIEGKPIKKTRLPIED